MDWKHIISLICVFVNLQISRVNSTGVISIRLLKYDNPSGTTYGGSCCGGVQIPGCPAIVKQCNNFFDVCIGENNSFCTLGETGISAGKEENSPVFDSNTQYFEYRAKFDEWKGVAHIIVNVTDTDVGGKKDSIDNFVLVYNGTLGTNTFVLEGSRTINPTKLHIEVKVSCEADYYGPQCSVYCKAGSVCWGHYTCNNKGEKVCKTGWKGELCNTQIPGGPADCNVYNGRKDFIPGLWQGDYNCQNEGLQQVTLNVSYNANSILVNAELLLPSKSVDVVGTYTYYPDIGFILVVEGKDGQITYRFKGSHVNNSVLSGNLLLGGKNCTARFQLSEAYFDGCYYADSCVRYGAVKSQYFCCCGKGNASSPCYQTTVMTKPISKTVPTTKSTMPSITHTPSTTTTTTLSTKKSTPSTESTTIPTTQPLTTLNPITKPSTSKSTTTFEPTTEKLMTKTTSLSLSTPPIPQTSLTTEKTTTKPTTSSSSNPKPTTHSTRTQPSTSQTSTSIETSSTQQPKTTEQSTKQQATTKSTQQQATNKSTITSQQPIESTTVQKTTSKATTQKQTTVHKTSTISTTEMTPATTPTSTSVPITTKPSYRPSKTFNFSLDIVKEEEDSALIRILKTAWIDENYELNLTSKQISIENVRFQVYIVQKGSGYRGYEIVTLYYNIVIHNVNGSLVKEPQYQTFQEALKTEFDGPVTVYRKSNHHTLWKIEDSFSIYVYGSGPGDEEMEDWQDAIKLAYNMSCDTDKCKNFSFELVGIKMMEEFMDVTGEEVTRVYFYVFKTGAEVSLSQPKITTYQAAFKILNKEVKFFQGEMYELKEYRFHYDLFVKGEVSKDDVKAFEREIDSAWKTLYPDDFASCTLCNTTVVRTEPYIGPNGEILTAIVYFFKIRQIWEMPVYRTPHKMVLLNLIHVTRKDNSSYELYTGSIQYRARHLWSIYINNYVLIQDRINFNAVVSQAFNVTHSGYSFSAKFLTEKIYIQRTDRRIVTKLIFSIDRNGEKYRTSFIAKETKLKINYRITNMLSNMSRNYTVANTSSLTDLNLRFELFLTTKLASVDFTGFLTKVLSTLKTSWKDYAAYKNLSFYFLDQEKVYMQNRSLAWNVRFFLTYSGNAVIDSRFVTPIITALTNLKYRGFNAQEYTLYTGQRSLSWLQHSSSYSLTFMSSVSEYDWSRISQDLAKEWCNMLIGCLNASSIKILITQQIKFVDMYGGSYYKLVYFVRYRGYIVDAQHYQSLSLQADYFKWKTVYGNAYRIYLHSSTKLWRYSYAFHLHTDREVKYQSQEYKELLESIKMAWYSMNYKFVHNCSCLEIIGLPQHQLYAGSDKTIWQLNYFIRYKKEILIDSAVWPHLDVSLVKLKSGKVLHSIDFWYYEYLQHFYSSHRVSVTAYHKLEKAMKEHWLKANPDYKQCGCVDVKISSQEEVLDKDGKLHWMLHYHIMKHGKPVKPSKLPPFNWASFNHTMKTISGQRYEFAWSWESFYKYVRGSHSGNLYLSSWVPSSYYGYFRNWMSAYYKHLYAGSNVSVTLGSKLKEFHSETGGSIWKLPFLLKVNGTFRSPPPPINTTQFELTFNKTSPHGNRYTIANKTDVKDNTQFFSLHFDHKITNSAKNNLSAAIIKAFVDQHPDTDPDSLNITFDKQEQIVDSENKKESWQLQYSISLNGTKLHTTSTQRANLTLLKPYLQIKGPNNVKYSLVDVDKAYTSHNFFSLYFTSYVSIEDRKKVETKIKEAWQKQYNSSSKDLTVSFVREKQLLNEHGKSVWKWDYVLKVNNTVQRTLAVLPVNHQYLSTAVHDITSVTTKRYDILQASNITGFYEYEKHFKLLVTSKITTTDIKIFKTELQKKWKLKLGVSVDVAMVKQEELVHSETGSSLWKLVYFIKKNAAVVDSREVDNLKHGSLPSIQGPHGPYSYHMATDVQKYLQYEWSGHINVNAKFGLKEKKNLKDIITKTITNNITDSLSNKVIVEINRHEQYLLKNGSHGWRVVYFVKLDGHYTQVSSLKNLDIKFVEKELNKMQSPRGENYRLLKPDDLLYNSRDRFTLFFRSEVSHEHFSAIKEKILSTWKSSMEYKNCNCLAVDIVESRNKAIEEVIDSKWTPYWQITYFLKRHNKTVESMTHVAMNITHLNKELSTVMSNKGSAYQAFSISRMNVKAINLMFSFQLNHIIGYSHRVKFNQLIKKTWLDTHKDYFSNTDLEVSINRMLRYVDVYKKGYVWQIDYSLQQKGIIIDPLEVPQLNMTELENQINFTHPTGKKYKVMKRSLETVQLRYKFQVFMDRKLRVKDLQWMKKAVESYLNTTGKPEFTNVIVHIPVQEGFLDSKGKLYWSLAIFLKTKSSGNYIDSRSRMNLNLTSLQQHINFKGVNNIEYTIKKPDTSKLRKYYQSFSVMLSKTVRETDLTAVALALSKAWKDTGYFKTAVTVDIYRQEEFISKKSGSSSRLIYYVHADSTIVNSAQVAPVNKSTVRASLIQANVSQMYHVQEETHVYLYESLFSFILKEPVLMVDTSNLEKKLALAWKSSKVEILHQEEQVDLASGDSVVKILYAVHNNSQILSAVDVDKPDQNTYRSNVDLIKSGTNKKYMDDLVGSNLILSSYSDLHHIDIESRVDIDDYSKIASSLKSVWNTILNGRKVDHVHIVKQERVLAKTGKESYRLSYKVTAAGNIELKGRYEQGPSITKATVLNVNNSGGHAYHVSQSASTYRSTQVYNFYLNRQIYQSNDGEFMIAVKSVVSSNMTEMNNVTIEVSAKKMVLSQKTARVLWQYSFVLSNKGEVIDRTLYPEIKTAKLIKAIHFTSPRKEHYEAENASESEITDYNDLFSLALIGQHTQKKVEQIKNELTSKWNANLSMASIPVILPEEYIDEEGTSVTVYRYSLMVNSKQRYSRLMRTPSYTNLAKRVALQLHTSGKLHKYSSCYKLHITRQQWAVNNTIIKSALEKAWTQTQRGKNYSITVVTKENAFGKLGSLLSTVLYTVEAKTSDMARLPLTPDMMLEPNTSTVESAVSASNIPVRLYKADFKPQRLSALYHVSIVKSGSTSVMKRSDVQLLQLLIQQSWKTVYNSNVKIEIVSVKKYSQLNTSVSSNRLYYKVTEANQMLNAWKRKVEIEQKLSQQLTQNATTHSRFAVSKIPETKIRELYIRGNFKVKDKTKVQQYIMQSWQSKFSGSTIAVNVLSMDKYTDSQWKKVTKVEYEVTINGSSPDNMKGIPLYDDIQKVLQQSGESQCHCVAQKLRKEYILKTPALNQNKIKSAIKSVWIKKNSALSDLTVSVRDKSKRSRRAASSEMPPTKLVGNDGKEIASLEYTLSAENQDPNPAFVDTPTAEDLATPMKTAGAELCGCTPKLAGTLTVNGETKDNEKPKLVEAVKEAFAKKNPDVNKGDLNATVTITNKKDSKGEPVADIYYELSYNDDAVEDLNPPSKLEWQRSLNTAGKTLHQTAPAVKKEKDENTWKTPVIIAVAIAAFVVILLIICYIIYIRKRSQKENLLKRGDQVTKRNTYDREHFSDPTAYDEQSSVAYSNPQYEQVEAMKQV